MNSNHFLLPDVAEMFQAVHLATAPVQVGVIGSHLYARVPGTKYEVQVIQEDNDLAHLRTRLYHGNTVVGEAVHYTDTTGELTVTYVAAMLQQLDAGPNWRTMADLTVRDVELRTLDVVIRAVLRDAWTVEDHRTVKAQLLRALDATEVAP
jgi:hypothetical protein